MVAGELAHDEHAQLQTLEGFAAALLMVGTVYLVVTAVTMSVPQTELHVDAQLKTYGRDALAILDASLPPEKDGDYYASLLKNSVVDWVNGVAGATSFETEEFAPSNPPTRYTSHRFEFAGPELDTNHTFEVRIPNNTRISHAYVTLTGMPLLNMSDGSTTDPPTKYELDAPNSSDKLGFGCAITHGDVNADGIPDIVVGAYGNNSDSGAVYVYYGNESGVGGWEDGPNVTILNPGASGDRFGWAVACGDVNNDSISDVIVGAHENDTTDTGVVYVYYGGATPSTHPDATIDNPRGTGKSSGWFGYSLACGDVNGDSYDDILIGAPTGVEMDMVPNRGDSFVYYGPISGNYGIGNESVKLHNPYNSSDFFGISVACFDINEDGKEDIIVGANATNRTYIRYGNTSLPSSIDCMDIMLYNDKSSTEFGISISSAGDVNNDGADDLVVGAPANDTAHIFYGGSLLDECADINLTGDSGFGRSVSASGDVDGDGYAGVIVGTPDDLAGVFYDVDLDVGPVNISGDSGFGSVVSDIGDVNNDTIPDIAVGAPDDGRVYVYTPMFPEEPWLAVGNETDLANGNGTKVWEYTTVIKTDNSDCAGGDPPPHAVSIPAGNSTSKTLPIYREITSDAVLSMYVKTGSSDSANVRISVNGVEVNASSPAINTSGNWVWHNITLPGDITEWRIGDNNITINVTSASDTLSIGNSTGKARMIRILLPITQPFKTTETTPDFADAINDWMDAHPLNNVTTYLLTRLPKYQWINLSTNETGWAVPFLLHSNSSGVINVTNLYIKATPSLDENLDALLPNFIEYNVIFAYLDTLTKGHVYTFSDGNYTNTSMFEDDGEPKTVNITLPINTTDVYIARMDVSGCPVYDTAAAERVNISTEHQHDPCIAVNATGTAVLTWTEGSGAGQQIYSAIRDGGGWSAAVPVNESSERQQVSSLGVNASSRIFVAWEEGDGANRRIYYTEDGIGTEVNASSETQTEPSLAVNDSGHASLAWTQNGSIHYSEYNRTAWSPAAPVNSSSRSQSSPSLAVNETGWAFLAWVEDAKIHYSEYNRTAWSPAMQISSAAHQSSPTIAVNDSGWVFAAGVHGTGVNARIYYALYNRTSWSTPIRVGDEVRQTNPDIAIDSENHTHLVWEQLGGIYYSMYDGNWRTPIMITDDGKNPTIAVDSSNIPHIAWERKDGIWYAGGASQTNYGHYPRLPYIVINDTKIWEYNITEINHDDNDMGAGNKTLCINESLSKIFDIDEDVDGPVIISMYARGNNSTFDVYVNDEYVRSGCMNNSKMWWNITTPSEFWQWNDNIVRINVTSGCIDWYYDNSTDNTTDQYNQTVDLPDDNTWMIRLYGHEYRGTETTDDFSDVLNRCLNPNATTEIEVTIHSDSEGNITLSRLRIYYYIRGNATQVTQKRIITHGIPPSDSVTTTKLITIQDGDIPNSTEARNDAEDRMPDASISPDINLWNLVEVRLELWYE